MQPTSEPLIRPARTPDDMTAAANLFRAYADWLDIDLSYQDFEAELAALPGKYAPPKGEILLALNGDGKAVGCVGLRPIEPDGVCEMKRLYVAPEGRGLGLGNRLVEAIIHVAERSGYSEMRLDTLPTMKSAISLYERYGFGPMERYYDTPIAETLFFRRKLVTSSIGGHNVDKRP